MTQAPSIFITGAASGIGLSAARLFAEKGWFTGLYDRDEQGLLNLSKTLGTRRFCYGVMDVSDQGSVQKAVDDFSAQTKGTMRALFNNAGILEAGYFETMDPEQLSRIVDVNLKGVMYCTHASLPLLKRTPGACVINMSSASSVYGTAHLAVYSATKAAVSSLTESLNLELENRGIHVCDIRVPYVNTPLLRSKTRAASIDKLGVKLTSDHVARLVYKAVTHKRIHHDGPGMRPLLMMRRLMPIRVQKRILKPLMLPTNR